MLRRILVVLFALVVALLIAAGVVYRMGVHPQVVLWVVQQTWLRTTDLDARLEGDTEVLGFQVSGAGRLRFSKPDLYDLDLSAVRLVAGKDALWAIVPALHMGLKVTAQGMTPAQVMAGVLSGWEERDPARWVQTATSSPQDVSLRGVQVLNGERCWVLDWPARTGERIGGRLHVSQSTRLPVKFEQMDSGGQVTHTYTLTQVRRNVGLKASDFEYHPLSGYRLYTYQYDPNDPSGLRRLIDQNRTALGDLQQRIEEKVPGASGWLKEHGL
jgi:outer membrane lipoprotein-sorting protein